MDITTLRDSKEALFADIMAATGKADSTATNYNLGPAEEHDTVAVELRRSDKKGRRAEAHSPKKLRPASMIALPSSTSLNYGGRVNGSALGSFAKPKAFFSCEQLLTDMVEGYNCRRDAAYKLKMLHAASQVMMCRVDRENFCLLPSESCGW